MKIVYFSAIAYDDLKQRPQYIAEKLAEKYEVDTIPTLILFKNGEMVDSVVNPASQDAIEEWLKENGAL